MNPSWPPPPVARPGPPTPARRTHPLLPQPALPDRLATASRRPPPEMILSFASASPAHHSAAPASSPPRSSKSAQHRQNGGPPHRLPESFADLRAYSLAELASLRGQLPHLVALVPPPSLAWRTSPITTTPPPCPSSATCLYQRLIRLTRPPPPPSVFVPSSPYAAFIAGESALQTSPKQRGTPPSTSLPAPSLTQTTCTTKSPRGPRWGPPPRGHPARNQPPRRHRHLVQSPPSAPLPHSTGAVLSPPNSLQQRAATACNFLPPNHAHQQGRERQVT